MRNMLAEDVLNENMLHLMTCYQRSLGDKGEELQGIIELLQHTSVIIKNFRDARPMTSYSDKRLDESRNVFEWFCTLGKQNKSLTNINKKELEKSLFSFVRYGWGLIRCVVFTFFQHPPLSLPTD